MTSFEEGVTGELGVSGEKSYLSIFLGFASGFLFFIVYYLLTRYYYNYFVRWNDLGAFGYPIISIVYVLVPSVAVFFVFKFLKKRVSFRRGLLYSLIIPFFFLLFVFTLMFFGATNDYHHQMAILERDVEYCNKIESSSFKERCLQDVFLVVNDYYFQMAVSSGDDSYCDEMSMPEHTIFKCRSRVASEDKTPLGLCSGADSCRKNLNDDYFYAMAVDTSTSYFCSMIESSRKGHDCYSELGMAD